MSESLIRALNDIIEDQEIELKNLNENIKKLEIYSKNERNRLASEMKEMEDQIKENEKKMEKLKKLHEELKTDVKAQRKVLTALEKENDKLNENFQKEFKAKDYELNEKQQLTNTIEYDTYKAEQVLEIERETNRIVELFHKKDVEFLKYDNAKRITDQKDENERTFAVTEDDYKWGLQNLEEKVRAETEETTILRTDLEAVRKETKELKEENRILEEEIYKMKHKIPLE